MQKDIITLDKDLPLNKDLSDSIMVLCFVPTGSDNYAALDMDKQILGYGCRRPCDQNDRHAIGPLYAVKPAVAEALMQQLCNDVAGCKVYMDIQ
jgi:hypothetical protein